MWGCTGAVINMCCYEQMKLEASKQRRSRYRLGGEGEGCVRSGSAQWAVGGSETLAELTAEATCSSITGLERAGTRLTSILGWKPSGFFLTAEAASIYPTGAGATPQMSFKRIYTARVGFLIYMLTIQLYIHLAVQNKLRSLTNDTCQ